MTLPGRSRPASGPAAVGVLAPHPTDPGRVIVTYPPASPPAASALPAAPTPRQDPLADPPTPRPAPARSAPEAVLSGRVRPRRVRYSSYPTRLQRAPLGPTRHLHVQLPEAAFFRLHHFAVLTDRPMWEIVFRALLRYMNKAAEHYDPLDLRPPDGK